MTIEKDFLSTIRDEPDDDGIRLIYADWLEEQGKVDRAEFIRLQCEIAGMDLDDPRRPAMELRAEDLLVRHRGEWTQGLPESVALTTVFERGFPEYAQVTAKRSEFLERIRGILALPLPPRTLGLTFKSTPALAEFNDLFKEDPRNVRLGATFNNCLIPGVLACSNVLTHIRALNMQAVHAPGQIEQLAACRDLRGLKHLVYADPQLTPAETDALLHNNNFRLEYFHQLGKFQNAFDDPSRYEYLGVSDFSGLRGLGTNVWIENDDERHRVMQRLADNASIRGIRKIDLAGGNLIAEDLDVLLQSPHVNNMRVLRISTNNLGLATGAMIAQSGLPLHGLYTFACSMWENALRPVLEGPAGQSLRTLECRRGITMEGLFRDISLPHLRRLIAWQCEITREDLVTVMKACPSLRHLDVRGGTLELADIGEIIASGDIDRLHMLKIDDWDMNFPQKKAYNERFPAMNDIPDGMPL